MNMRMHDPETSEKTRPKILIVDDRVENLVALERILQDLAVETIRASSGNEALELSLNNEFAMALVDVQMPEMDGFEMVELLHQQKKTELLPVIFVSAVYSGEYYKLKGVEVGAIDFIEKPIIPDLLRGKVRIFLKLHEFQELQKKLNKSIQVNNLLLKSDLEKANQLLAEETQKYDTSLEALNSALNDLEETKKLKKMVHLMADRELRMAELKKEITRLNNELSQNKTG